jgi:hypothetical protein
MSSRFLFHGLVIDEHEMNKIGITSIHLRHDRGAEFSDPVISSIIHQEDSKENNYNHFNRFNAQIQYGFMNLRSFVGKSGKGLR